MVIDIPYISDGVDDHGTNTCTFTIPISGYSVRESCTLIESTEKMKGPVKL